MTAAVPLPGTPLPHRATVIAAPAASPPEIESARHVATLIAPAPIAPLLAAPTAAIAPAPAAAASPPTAATTTPLDVPADFRAQLATAVREGVADATAYARGRPRSERDGVVDWALLRMKFPPRSDEAELQQLHRIASARTDAGVARARFWSEHGLTEEWERLLEDYARRAGPVQAQRARKLLGDALMMVNTITQTAKASNLRQRPFAVDPSLPLAVDKPGNNPSYPSGHTSAAFAACTVLAHLMPDRAQEFMAMASEASWARVYSGVHFPSDVMAGAKLATTVATHLARTSGAAPIRAASARS